MTWPTKDNFVDGDVLTAAQVNNIADNLNLADPTGITDGYVLTADGAGSMGWEALPAAGGMTVIASGSLPSASTLSLTSIPNTYKDIRLRIYNLTFGSSTDGYWRINNLSAANYTYWRAYGYTLNSQSNQSVTEWPASLQNFNGSTTNGVWEFYIPGYAQNAAKLITSTWGYFGAFSSYYQMGQMVGYYTADVIVNRLDLICSTSFTGGTYQLLGVN